MKLTENFNIDEFACKDGTDVPQSLYGNVSVLAKNLQVLRDEVGVPIYVLSGYRTRSHNTRVGGARHSQHLLAKASDIRITGFSPIQVYNKIEELIKAGKMEQGGLGRYNTFVHYDIRGVKARWLA